MIQKQGLTSGMGYYFTYTRHSRSSEKSMGFGISHWNGHSLSFGIRHSFIQLKLSSHCLLRIVLGKKRYSEDKKDPCLVEIIF